MTDTRVLDEMMKVLDRNPLNLVAPNLPPARAIVMDDKPFYAKDEVRGAPVYDDRVAVFHDDLTAPRLERPRRGPCGRTRTIIEEDGSVNIERLCGGEVHAVETIIGGAVRVDGRCLACGWELHRAGVMDRPVSIG